MVDVRVMVITLLGSRSVLCWALRDVPCRDVACAASAVNRRHYTGCEGNKKADKCMEKYVISTWT